MPSGLLGGFHTQIWRTLPSLRRLKPPRGSMLQYPGKPPEQQAKGNFNNDSELGPEPTTLIMESPETQRCAIIRLVRKMCQHAAKPITHHFSGTLGKACHSMRVTSSDKKGTSIRRILIWILHHLQRLKYPLPHAVLSRCASRSCIASLPILNCEIDGVMCTRLQTSVRPFESLNLLLSLNLLRPLDHV